MKYLLNLSDGYCESSSNAHITVSADIEGKIRATDIIRNFVEVWRAFFTPATLKKHCENAKKKGSNFCPSCGKNLKAKANEDEEELHNEAAEAFQDFLGGTVDGHAHIASHMKECGWQMWASLEPGNVTVISCCFLSDIIRGERVIEDWYFSEHRYLVTNAPNT